MTRKFIAAAAIVLAAVALSGCGTLLSGDPDVTGSIGVGERPATGHVYIFRGIGGRFATLDLDRLAERIKRPGVSARVYDFMDWRDPAEEAIKRYRAEQQPAAIIVLGHSAGADVALRFAERLKEDRVPVSLVVTLDPTRLPHDVPQNVDRFINIYASLNFFGGGSVKSGSAYRGHFTSIDLKNYWEVPHVRMLRIGGLGDKLADKIVRVATAPARLDGVTVPIRYVMPRDVPVELWDSGVPVKAEAGDTVAKLAARYAVPAWAVAEINDIDAKAALSLGQRVVVPRMLDASPGSLTSFAAPAR